MRESVVRPRDLGRTFPGPGFPSATALSHAGLKFKKSRTDDLMDIHFEGRFHSLPRILVKEDTDMLFLNLMALERFDVTRSHEVSSYFAFMDLLIRSVQDLKLLRPQGIIIVNESEESDNFKSCIARKSWAYIELGLSICTNRKFCLEIKKFR